MPPWKERFGGRFPEDVLPELETCRQVVEAVTRYLGVASRGPRVEIDPDSEIPSAYYRVDEFPESLQLGQSLAMAKALDLENPYFKVHQGLLSNRTMIDGREYVNFASFNYLGMSGDPVVAQAAMDAVDRYGTSVSASRARLPARRTCTGNSNRPSPGSSGPTTP